MSKNIFFISDTHFGHDNMYKFLDYSGERVRPIAENAEEGDEIMTERWNSVVKPNDKVYHLGDVVFRASNRDEIMKRLNGEKILVKGNHDRLKLCWYSQYFKDVRGTVHIDGNYLLSHFPVHPDSKGRFVRNLHGHIHSQLVMKTQKIIATFANGDKEVTDYERTPDLWYRNCCVERNNYTPIPFELIKEETENLIQEGVIVIPKK